ncbi:retrovirus-related pol polyprotein from transposon TNT 1-94 [Tanacetum coccineum]
MSTPIILRGMRDGLTSMAYMPGARTLFDIVTSETRLVASQLNTIASKEPLVSLLTMSNKKVLAPGMYAIEVKPIPHPLKNNRSAHLNFISHLKESVETVREIVEEARVVKPWKFNQTHGFESYGKTFADIGLSWRPTGKNSLGKLLLWFSMEPTGKNLPYGTYAQCLLKHLYGASFKAHEFWWKSVHRSRSDSGMITSELSGLWRLVMGDSIIKGKKYILVIVDDYSRFTWVKFLRSKDETPEFVTNFLKQIQVGLNKTVRFIRTDNGTEFVNQVMSEYYEGVGIFHQTSVPRTPQQNGVVERRNRTLVEAARTMMIFSKAPMFLWAEAVATACYTQNRSLIHTRHNKTPYELVHDKKPDLTFFRVFGALCYPANDSENLGKFQAKADIGIFVGYAPSRKGYRIYNKRTRRLMETIHVTFDEMHQSMAPVHTSSGPAPFIMTPGQLKSGLAPTDKELEMLFQPMFDEHLEQSRVNEPVPSATEFNAQVVPPGTSLLKQSSRCTVNKSPIVKTDIQLLVQHQRNCRRTHSRRQPQHLPNVFLLHSNLVTGDPGSHYQHLGMLMQSETQPDLTTLQIISEMDQRSPLITLLAIPHVLSNPKLKMAVIDDCSFSQQDDIHEFDRLEVWKVVPPQFMIMVNAPPVDLQRMDVKNCFLNGESSRISPVVSQPDGFEDQDNPSHDITFSQSPGGIFINQAKYALETLKKYGMDLSDPVDTPMVDRLKGTQESPWGIHLTKLGF